MTGAGGPVAAGTLEQRYLAGTFEELCRIASPSRSERACAQRVGAELGALGAEVIEDRAGEAIGGDCGNLLARIPGRPGGSFGELPPLLLCAHLDTVPLQGPVEPVLEDGFWQNAGEGILGADNKAAVVVLLALARRVRREGAPVDLELLFTVGEEISLAGCSAFDASVLHSPCGYVFDHASPIGEVILAAPCHYRIEASFRGAAAHAGICPEDGRSAILAASRAIASLRHGRLEDEGTVNVGSVEGGGAINVVPDACRFAAEVRGLDDRRGEALVAEVVDRVHQAANMPDCDVDVDTSVQRMFGGYRHAPSAPAVRAAEAALSACGHDPVRITSGGGSDANALIAQGVATVNLANGTERSHEPGERVADAALEEMLRVARALLDEAAPLASELSR